MKAPQIIVICLLCMEFVLALMNHGKPKTGLDGEHNIFVKMGNIAVLLGLLWWGGFWI